MIVFKTEDHWLHMDDENVHCPIISCIGLMDASTLRFLIGREQDTRDVAM